MCVYYVFVMVAVCLGIREGVRLCVVKFCEREIEKEKGTQLERREYTHMRERREQNKCVCRCVLCCHFVVLIIFFDVDGVEV